MIRVKNIGPRGRGTNSTRLRMGTDMVRKQQQKPEYPQRDHYDRNSFRRIFGHWRTI